MPYNLRKRKEPPVVEQEPPKEKKARRRAPTPATKTETKTPTPKPTPAPTATEKPKPTATAKPTPVPTPAPEPAPKEPPKVVKTESNLLAFGSDMSGELGTGKIGVDKKNPTPVALKQRVKQVACGGMHTIALTEKGQVFSYGCNDDGALGRITDGDETLEATPTLVELKDKVKKITAGDSHCAALTEQNEVYVWGNFRDENGMVGLLPGCNGKATLKPTKVDLNKKLKDIASGANHMLLLDVDGVVYSFGVGDHGQLGRLNRDDCREKLNAETSELFLKPCPVDFKEMDPQPFICDAIFAGEYTSFATNTDKKKNRLAGWGLNNYYQLGYKGGASGQLDQYYPKRCTFTCSTSIINVSGGQHHTIFLSRTGRVYAAGRHEYGMLGIGKSMKDKKEICPARTVEGFDGPITSICSGSRTSFAVSSAGKLYSWGMNSLNLGVDGDDDLIEPTLVKKLADREVTAVSSGSITSVIVT